MLGSSARRKGTKALERSNVVICHLGSVGEWRFSVETGATKARDRGRQREMLYVFAFPSFPGVVPVFVAGNQEVLPIRSVRFLQVQYVLRRT